jgi:hypothetical protein
LGEGGWDFGDSSYVSSTTEWDIGFAVTATQRLAAVPGQGELLLANWPSGAGVQFAPPGVPFDSLLVAPDNGYSQYLLAIQYESYFVLTQEGLYAKIELQSFGDYEKQFRFVFQDDGSTNLDPTVAVESRTWGRVKSLYR